MGEVYRARDTTLERDVAVKVLAAEFVADPSYLARLEREAKLLAGLNHPNIATIHSLEQAAGRRFLVLELVEGESLRQRLANGPLPVDKALDLCVQIAQGLEAAHGAGIVHRDLKPDNVLITPQGRAKLLDFGNAKSTEVSPELTETARATDLTVAGTLVGTPPYMSPEQIRGEAIDKRADIWAFGCLLYETLTATRAFARETLADTLAAIVDREPDWTCLPNSVPPLARSVMQRCLRKERSQRLHDIADARIDIQEALAEPGGDAHRGRPETVATTVPDRQSATRIVGVVMVLAAVLLGALVGSRFTRPEPGAVERFVLTAPPSETAATDRNTTDLAVSPDGTRVVYRSALQDSLYLRAVDQLQGALLRDTESGAAPFFSPDGNWVGFRSRDRQALMKAPVLGGPAQTICPLLSELRGASWGADGTIIFAERASGGLLRVSAAGGEPEVLTVPDAAAGEIFHRWPQILPGGEAVLYTSSRGGRTEDRSIALLTLATGDHLSLVPLGSNPHYSATGHIVFGLEGTLRAVRFDLGRLEVTDEPVRVLEDVMTKSGTRGRAGRQAGAANFALANNGSLVYISSDAQTPKRTLVWVDRQGQEEALSADPRMYQIARISPDGTVVALDSRDEENDIWIWSLLSHGPLARLTFDRTPDFAPAWAPDGRVLFSSRRHGPAQIFARSPDGSGTAEQLTDLPNDLYLDDVSPDGGSILARVLRADTGWDIVLVTLGDEGSIDRLVESPAQERYPRFSPDGRWLAYQSDESGQDEIYVVPFPDVDGGKREVSHGGGMSPVWNPQGGELFYRALDGRVMAVPIVAEGTTLTFGSAEVLWDNSYYLGLGRSYDVAEDGERLLMIKDDPSLAARRGAADIVIVRNWFEQLKRLVPTGP